MKKSILIILINFTFSPILFSQFYFPSPGSNSGNQNVGINQTSPTARLHISDDPLSLSCTPAILINSILGENSTGEEPGLGGPESSSCSTPFVFRNITTDQGNNSAVTYNLSSSGATILGDIFNFPSVSSTFLSIENNLGIYLSPIDFLRLGFDFNAKLKEPLLYWNSSNSEPFSLGYGTSINNVNRVLSLLNSNRVGINTTSPIATLHVKSEIDHPNDPNASQIQGLLIENNGYNNNDFALEVRTGQQPAGATMTNGRVFTISNAGTVHIGPMLNWQTPSDGISEFKLYVEKGIRTERIRVDIADQNGWADYVFEESYTPMPTAELEDFIKKYKHLPGVPSTSEVLENGLDLAEMNKILLEKIEELTLKIIELEKSNIEVQKTLNKLTNQ